MPLFVHSQGQQHADKFILVTATIGLNFYSVLKRFVCVPLPIIKHMQAENLFLLNLKIT